MGFHEKVSARDVAGDYLSSTSAHGVPRIHSSKSLIRKFLWSVIFVASFTAFTINGSTLIANYFKYPFVTEMSITFNKTTSFPSITICNQNPIRMSKIKQSKYLNDMLTSQMPDMMAAFDEQMTSLSSALGSSFFPDMRDWMEDYTYYSDYSDYTGMYAGGEMNLEAGGQAANNDANDSNTTQNTTETSTTQNTTETYTVEDATESNTTEVPATTENNGGYALPDYFGQRRKRDTKRDDESLKRNKRGDYYYYYYYDRDYALELEDMTSEEKRWEEDATEKMKKTYFQYLAQVNVTDRVVMGHQKEDFIIKCTFNGMKCSNSSFVQFITYNHGNCYTFNHRKNGEQGLVVTKAGSEYGLSLDLNIEQYEYLSGITDTAGVRVVIHSYDEKPHPQNNGFSLAPGLSTRIGLKQREIKRLGLPWGNCSSGGNYYKPTGYNYSVQACLNNCLQSEIVKTCGCRYLSLDWEDETIRPCNDTMRSIDEVCISNVTIQFINDALNCSCPARCKDAEYQLSFSQAKWPSLNEKTAFEQEVAQSNDRLRVLMASGSDFAKAENNFAQLKVFYQELNFEKIQEVEGYPWPNLLGDIGGQLGLWIGFSVITVTEFLEFIYDLIMIALYKVKPPGKRINKVKAAPPEHALNSAF